MAQKRRTAHELVNGQPGAWHQRQAIILALCQGATTDTPHKPNDLADYITATADRLLENIHNG